MRLTVASEELEDTANQIIQLYNKYLGRDPLQDGLDAWINTNQNIEQIEQGIANSPEASVFETFNETIGRDPTMEERDFFVNVNPSSPEIVEEVLSNTQEAQQFQTQQQLDQTDILADTTDDNTIDAASDVTSNGFAGSSYDDVLEFYEETGFGNRATPGDFRTDQEEQALKGLTQDDSGRYYNADGERVYAYRDSAELGDDSGGLAGQQLVMRTEAEIRNAWNSDEGMGYFKEANPQMDVDTYMSFISEKDDLYASGVLNLTPQNELYNEGHKGRGPNADAINAILDEEKANVQASEREAQTALNNKYGIQTAFQNEDGDQFEFNGATYTKTMKVDDHLGVGEYVKMGASVLMSVYAAPLLAGSLGAVMGPVAAKATAAAIVSQATAFMNGQDLSIGDALRSAAMAYGGAKLGDLFASGGELSGAVGEITDTVTSATDSFNELITTGNSIADAAIKAGGMSMLTSLVTTGEVDLESAGLAALMAGGAEALGKLNSSLFEQGVEGVELEEVVVTAQKKGIEVGDGLTQLDNGTVINSSGDIMGTMDDLDLDGDGMLSGNDLQNITTNNQFVSEQPPLEDPFRKNGARVYLDSEGNVYTQDQISYYVDGSQYGDIYMVDGQEILLEQGTMINGRMMFDGDGDGVFDVVYNDKGRVVGSYNPETMEWEDAGGNTSASIGEYMRTVNPTTGESGIENPFNMSREAYEAMTGEEYVKDLFALKASAGGTGVDGMLLALDDGEIVEMVARFEKHPYVDPKTGDLLYGKEGLERYLQNEGIGVNYSGEQGWRFETNVDTSDGIYGIISDSKNVGDFLGAPDTTKDSNLRTIADIETAVPIKKDPFVDPVDPIKPVTVETADSGGGSNTSQQAVTDFTKSLSNSSSSSSAASAVTSAAASGLSAIEIATVVNNALSGGAINSESASAALSALEGIASKGEISDSGVLNASGDLVTDTGSSGTTVTVSKQDSGMLTGNNTTAGASVSELDSSSAISENVSGVITGSENITTANNVTGGVAGSVSGVTAGGSGLEGSGLEGSGLEGSGLEGSGLDGSGLEGSGLDGSGVDGSGLEGSGVDGSGIDGSGTLNGTDATGVTGVAGTANVVTTTDASTTAGSTITPTTGPPGPGTTVSVVDGKGKGKGGEEGDGEGPGKGLGIGLGGAGVGGATGMLTGQEFTPLSKTNIRIQAKAVPEVAIQLEDPVAQLARLAFAPYGDKPSGIALDGLLTSLTSSKGGA